MISFIEQIKRTFILIILIPFLLLGSFIFYSSYSYVNQQKQTETSNIIEQNVIDLDNRMLQCENSLRYAAANYSLQEFLQIKEASYKELSDAEAMVGPLLYNTLLSNQYYKKIKVYTEKYFQVMNDLIEDAAEVERESWYQDTLQTAETCWWYLNDTYYISRRIQSAYPKKTLGVIQVELKPEFMNSSFKIFENCPVQIALLDRETVKTIYGSEVEFTKSGYSEDKELSSSGWRIHYEIPEIYFREHSVDNLLIPILVMCAVLLLTWLLFHIQSKRLVRELDKLVEEVNQVETGNLDVTFEPAKIKEIHVLAVSIERMLGKIKQLIRQVYTKEIERQDLELNLLQSKISPHFLYNNLSAINWIAIDNGQDKIYEITTEMAAFYRSSLNRGKNVDKLYVEVTNIKAYVNLQLISHENSFDVDYEIDENLMNQDIPIFILQPLVENAIEHGIDELRETRGFLRISILEKENNFELAVFDNGMELYEKIGEHALEISEYGYGTENVHRRVQLFYGKEYGLEVVASQEGTTSRIVLKRDGLKKTYTRETPI